MAEASPQGSLEAHDVAAMPREHWQRHYPTSDGDRAKDDVHAHAPRCEVMKPFPVWRRAARPLNGSSRRVPSCDPGTRRPRLIAPSDSVRGRSPQPRPHTDTSVSRARCRDTVAPGQGGMPCPRNLQTSRTPSNTKRSRTRECRRNAPAKIANSPKASKHGGEKSHSGSGRKHQGGTTAQHKAAGRKGGKASAGKK